MLKEAARNFFGFVIDASSRNRKGRRTLLKLKGIGDMYPHFITAKDKVDECAAEGLGAPLTIEETKALDWVLDRQSKGARKLKKMFDKYL